MADDDPLVSSLASLADVAVSLGRDLTDSEKARLVPVLLKASALFRREARQTFTAGRTQPRLKVNGGRVYLPERPVTTVHSVVDDCGAAVEWTRKDQWLTTCLGSSDFVTVDYTHGETPLPADHLARLTVAEIAGKITWVWERNQPGVTGYTKTAGPFSETWQYAGWAQGGSASLSPDDTAVARGLRVRVPTVHVAPSPIPRGTRFGSQLPGLP